MILSGDKMPKSIWERKWKVAGCGIEEYDCWCRIIVAADAEPKKSDGEYYKKDTFISAGRIAKSQAEFFVGLHNNALKDK